MTLVVAFEDMDDETAIKHLEARHVDSLFGLKFLSHKVGKARQFRGSRANWDTHHSRLHRAAHDHIHERGEGDAG